MNPALDLVKKLRSLELPESHARELRALFVAQYAAYNVPLDIDQLGSEEGMQQYAQSFNKIVGDVNEYTPVDIKLGQSFFTRLIKARIKLLHQVSDVTLLKACLSSDTTRDELGMDTQALVDVLCGVPGFGRALGSLDVDVFQPNTDVVTE